MESHKLDTKRKLLQNRKWRIRKTVKGSAARPRLSLKITNKHIYAQAIDDTVGNTLCYLSSLNLEGKVLANVAGCTKLGEEFGALAKKKGITQVVFDRNGRRYHGSVKAFADAVRKVGINF
jgi:large subunit ribosomal protein L18